MVHDLMQDFHIGAGDLGILSACFFYAYALMQIPAGWLLDRFGARQLLSVAILVSACGVLLFSEASSFSMACLGRFAIGFGSAFAFVSTLYLLSRWFEHRYFSILAGFVQLGACIGSIVGLTPIALLVGVYGWRGTLWWVGIGTLGLSVIFWLIIRDQPQHTQTTPRLPQKALSVSAYRTLLQNRQIWWVCLCGFCSWIPVSGIGALWGVPYLMHVYSINNAQAGLLITGFWLGIGLGSPIVGALSQRLRRRRLPIVHCFIFAILASLLLMGALHLPMWMTGLALVLLGISASVQSLTFGVLKDSVPAQQFGFAAGMNNMAAIVGGGLAQPLIGFLLAWGWHGHYANGVPLYTLSNYQHSLYLLPVVACLGLVSALQLKETHCDWVFQDNQTQAS